MPDLSPTLGINERVRALRAEGRRVHHLGFGESPFPAPPRLVEALAAHAHEKSYLPVAGLPALRETVAAHQWRLTGHDPADVDVLIGPGSKSLLFAIQMAIPGDLLLPVPSWVSYAPQAALLGQHVVPVPTRLDDAGYHLEPAALRDAIAAARRDGREPTKLLVNFPNNPAGMTLDAGAIEAIAEVCRREDVVLISDEIYGRTSYDQRYRSAGPVYPEGTVVTSGLSKHLSLGGWRLGVALVPKARAGLFETLCHIASETWSCVAAPVQHAAVDAYAGHADVEDFVRDTTAVHALVNRHLAHGLRALGADCPLPQGGFYCWPDFTDVLGARFRTARASSPRRCSRRRRSRACRRSRSASATRGSRCAWPPATTTAARRSHAFARCRKRNCKHGAGLSVPHRTAYGTRPTPVSPPGSHPTWTRRSGLSSRFVGG